MWTAWKTFTRRLTSGQEIPIGDDEFSRQMTRQVVHSLAARSQASLRVLMHQYAKNWSCIAFALLHLSACSPIATVVPVQAELTHCAGARPEMCAQVYAPVCATLDPELKSERKTYSNACMACADRAVRAYRAGSCDGD